MKLVKQLSLFFLIMVQLELLSKILLLLRRTYMMISVLSLSLVLLIIQKSELSLKDTSMNLILTKKLSSVLKLSFLLQVKISTLEISSKLKLLLFKIAIGKILGKIISIFLISVKNSLLYLHGVNMKILKINIL